MENLFYLVILLALGKGSQNLPVFPENTSVVLNQFVIWLSLPATVFLKINGIALRPELRVLAAIPWILVFLAIGSVGCISKFLKWEKRLTGA